ncbi:OVCH1 protein, partial [Neodrepanis coruscans]|nr:OVCH1 protein [Neodrepanis coruscans]
QMRQVKTSVVPPHFSQLSYDSDIALLQPNVSLAYTAAVRPVCLPNSSETSSSSLCAVSGWGSSKKVSLLILYNEICEINCYFNYPGGITARMLCAGFVPVGGQDS